MKKGLLIVMCLVCFTCFATIQNSDIQAKLISIVRAVKVLSVNTARDLGNLKSEAQEVVSNWGDEISADDKTDLQVLNTKVTIAKDALDDINDYVVATWRSID